MTDGLKKAIDALYPARARRAQYERYEALTAAFRDAFGAEPDGWFSAPGRSEICGNHTDHNMGKVMAAAIDLDVASAAAKDDDGLIVVASDSFPTVIVDVDDLEAKPEEEGTSIAIVRGVAARMKELGYEIGGFKAFNTTNVLKGSGMSSSAAFEILICTLLSHFYNEGNLDPVEAAKISQYAENVYFGKPSGLMDQTACSVGGFVRIDFKDITAPVITPIAFDFEKTGYDLVITDCRADHADATADYASIREDMRAVSRMFGKEYLREVDEGEFRNALGKVRAEAGDLGVMRAIHFFEENKTVDRASEALQNGDFAAFRREIIRSGRSSYMYLQNIYSPAHPKEQALAAALCVSEQMLDGVGAWRVHGGGFGGTIQAFVPSEMTARYIDAMEQLFGEGCCYNVSVRPKGGVRLF